MKLVSATVKGAGRIVDSKINLDAKVIAIVGPNEAGKTTLLRALAHVDGRELIGKSLHSRAAEVADDSYLTTLDFVVQDSDLNMIAELDLREPPRRVRISRRASGEGPIVEIVPRPVRSIAPLEVAVVALQRVVSIGSLGDWLDPATVYADPDSDAARNYLGDLKVVIEAVNECIVNVGSELSVQNLDTVNGLQSATLDTGSEGEELLDAYDAILRWSERADVLQKAVKVFWGLSPDFLMFGEHHRSIQSSYTFDDDLVAEPPPALANLATLADLNLSELLEYVQSGDVSRRRTAIATANVRMDSIFRDAWKQSELSVHFELDGDQLRIELMEDRGNVTVFDERSAGLRMYVALVAFMKVQSHKRPQILLIDEAENHLHIDAQADLVNMFSTQQYAEKVIYTTHSPACLPADLGAGIRVVVPSPDRPQVSNVRNSFWEGAGGYSPLMMAMGASAAAFTPARLVLLAEGATEMILLPTLIREATGETTLPYQVAPGLSEVPNRLLASLDLEGAKVAYLVDGDPGGRALAKSLRAAGVPDRFILSLDAPGVENVVSRRAYGLAIESLLSECNPGVDLPPISGLSFSPDGEGGSVSKVVEEWSKLNALNIPSKVAVASRIVQSGEPVLPEASRELLKELHRKLLEVFKVGSD